MNKTLLLEQVIATLNEKLSVLEKAARSSHAEATHESSKAETNMTLVVLKPLTSLAFLTLSCDEDRVDQRQPAARTKAPTVINRSVFMVIVIRTLCRSSTHRNLLFAAPLSAHAIRPSKTSFQENLRADTWFQATRATAGTVATTNHGMV